MTHTETHQALEQVTRNVDSSMRECIDACANCHAVCVATIDYCLKKGGDHANPEHIRTLQDCADVCRTSADLMLRGSPIHGSLCGVCAEACARAAESSAQWPDDEVMSACAEACRACAESCRSMAEGSGAH